MLQQSDASNGTLPGVLPDQRIVVTSTGLQTDGGDSANITGASAYDRISSIEDDALGTNITSPYKRLIRCHTAIIMILITSISFQNNFYGNICLGFTLYAASEV